MLTARLKAQELTLDVPAGILADYLDDFGFEIEAAALRAGTLYVSELFYEIIININYYIRSNGNGTGNGNVRVYSSGHGDGTGNSDRNHIRGNGIGTGNGGIRGYSNGHGDGTGNSDRNPPGTGDGLGYGYGNFSYKLGYKLGCGSYFKE